MTIHILVFPFPAQGHMIPLLDFTDQLLARGLRITVLVTPKNVHFLDHLLSKHPTLQTLILPFPQHDLIPKDIEHVKDLPHTAFFSMIAVMGGLKKPILNWFKSHLSPPVAILSDFFLGWTNELACELGISRIVFSPSGAFTLALLDSTWSRLPQKPVEESDLIPFDDVPNSPAYPWWQISANYRNYKMGDPVSEIVRDSFLANMASWGVVVNTFDKLESIYLDHLTNVVGRGRVWSVGPIIPNSNMTGRGGSSNIAAGDLLSWLNMCPDNSVVYICFGSQEVLSKSQMEAIMVALETSGARFIWVVKELTLLQSNSECGMVPPEFEDRVVGRGLVIKGWVPQVMILNHRAIASFLTHCGWNSVMESIVAGVPMLAWPMGADQFNNAMLLDNQLGVGVKVCEGRDAVPKANKLAKAMADSVGENLMYKTRALELSRASTNAVELGGNSFNSLDCFIKALATLSSPTFL